MYVGRHHWCTIEEEFRTERQRVDIPLCILCRYLEEGMVPVAIANWVEGVSARPAHGLIRAWRTGGCWPSMLDKLPILKNLGPGDSPWAHPRS